MSTRKRRSSRQNKSKNRFLKLRDKATADIGIPNGLNYFLMFICVVGFISAFRFGTASLDFYSVQNSIDIWNKQKNVQSEEDFLKAKSSILTAKFIHFSHPLYADITGQVLEWGVVAGYLKPESLNDAKSAYLKATKLRPSWPVTWASLAMIKWRLQQFDDEMLQYLNNANTLGPVKPEVHRLYVELGLSLYNANHPFFISIRDSVKERLVLGLRNKESRPYIIDFIQRTKSKKTACRWIADKDTFVKKQVLSCE
ncbi:VpsP family polysaccharide biosynthesis protein [Glaciecola sp. 1036]|uniref:VpsP family polysaccharide biosynthesis protein n=1 Tax=Alteromonadaceae TaxID=72275 RepID=UPI003D06DCF2